MRKNSNLKNQISKPQLKDKISDRGKRVIEPESLEQLLSKITKDNLHEEFFTGPAVGKEEF
jgi:hypothetical protein